MCPGHARNSKEARKQWAKRHTVRDEARQVVGWTTPGLEATEATGVSWSDLHFNSLHFVVGCNCSLLINSTDIYHQWGYHFRHWIMLKGSQSGIWAGIQVLWEPQRGQPAQEGKLSWGRVPPEGWAGEGEWRREASRQGSSISNSLAGRENLAPKSQEEARQHLRWEGAGWCWNPDKELGSRTWCPL